MIYVPKGETIVEFTVSRSRFITYLKEADTIDDAVSYRREIRARHGDATHVCYAAVTAEGQKASDDGEPKGTAQLPMLQVLKANNLSAVAVTVRYFGGIKLGTGGLNAAYGKGVADAVKAATLLEKHWSVLFQTEVMFSHYESVKAMLKSLRCPIKIVKEQFLECVTLTAAVAEESFQTVQKKITEVTLGTSKVTQNKLYYEIYPLEG